jgi:DNA invertase Pin-like site-specific DNA recombinase
VKHDRSKRKKIGLYIRVSTDDQDTDECSPKSQHQRLLIEIDRKNYGGSAWGEVVKVYKGNKSA